VSRRSSLGNTAIEEDNFPNDQLRPDLFQVVDLLAGIAQGQQLPD
jgi:hypothetical protein